jgi:predicted RNase H-like HicB family nuclease
MYQRRLSDDEERDTIGPVCARKIVRKTRLDSLREKAMAKRTFTAVLHREGKWFVADCPEVGTVSQGKTIEEALANLKEATELYLEEFPLPECDRTMLTTFEAVCG